MLKNIIISFFIGVLLSIYLLISGCGNLVIKIQKKPNSSQLHTEESVQVKKNVFELSDDFLADIDSLKNLTIDEFFNTAKGKDFRDAIRAGFREYRSQMIAYIKAPSDPKHLEFDPQWICANNKLNLNIEDINKYLGPIFKISALASLKQKAAKALNQNLADHIDGITALILGELGIKVLGNTEVDNNGEMIITKAKLDVSLIPFDSDPQEIQEKDKKENLIIEFVRELKNNDEGTFNGTIIITEKTDNNEQKINTYKSDIDITRKIIDKNKILFRHSGIMKLSLNDKETYTRKIQIDQIDESAQKFKINDIIKIYGKEESVKTIDVDFVQMCKVTNITEEKQDPPKTQPKEDNEGFKEDGGNTPIAHPAQNPAQNPVQK